VNVPFFESKLPMRRFAIIAVCFACAVLATRPVVRGYVTEGHVWGTTTVPYYVNTSNLYVSSSAVISDVQKAAAAWSTQSKANIQLVYAGTTSANTLTLDYQSNVFFRNDSNGSLGAETHWWYDATGKMIDADIVFHEASYRFYANNTGCSGVAEYIQDLATHEFGHVLGLGHSTISGATMYPVFAYCDTSQESLSSDDIAGIQALYPPTKTISLPSAPTSLAVKLDLLNPLSALDLTWADTATNASGYYVERSSDGVSFSRVAQLGATATSYTNGGLLAGLLYYYRVQAYNTAGASAYSNVASSRTQTQTTSAPSAPTSLTVHSDATSPTSSLDLTWTNTATNASGYNVDRSTDGVSFTRIVQLGSTATSYRSTGLAAGTRYYFRVSAYNSGGTSAFSNVASGTTQAALQTSVPGVPSSPSPANGATGVSTSVGLSWSDSGAQSYDVYLGSTLIASNIGSSTFSVSNLAAGTTYSWKVVAKNSAGSTSGPAWSFTTAASTAPAPRHGKAHKAH